MFVKCLELSFRMLKKDNNENKNYENKYLVEALKFVFEFDISAIIINHKPSLIKDITSTFMSLSEENGHKLMRMFNLFIVTNMAEKFEERTIKELTNEYFNHLSHLLDNLILKLKEIHKQKNVFRVGYNQKDNKIKRETYENSIIIFEEVFNHLINLIEEFARSEKETDNFDKHSKYFQNHVQNMCLKYLQLISLEIHLIKEEIDSFYFYDYIQVSLKSLHFFGNLITKNKEGVFKGNAFLSNMSNMISKENLDKKNILVSFVLDVMKEIPYNYTKFKIECFSNIKMLFHIYPDVILANFDQLLNDSFFKNSSKMRYSNSEINKIYFFWISTLKQILKNNNYIIDEKFKYDTCYRLFENVTSILFDETINSNYVLNILNFMINLFDIFKKKVEKIRVDDPEMYENFLACFFNQLTRYLNIMYKDNKILLEKLIKNFENNDFKKFTLDNLSKKSKEDLKDIITKNSENILEEELITRDTFDSKFKSEILVQNSLIIENEHITKRTNFIEDNIVRKLNVVNELIVKVYKQYKKVQIFANMPKTSENTDKKKDVYHSVRLTYPELNRISKIYKYNLKIFELIITHSKIYEGEKLIESVKFNFIDLMFWTVSIYVHREEGINHKFITNYRQIYQIINENALHVIQTFKNIYKTNIENYIYFYQVIFGVFGAFDARTSDQNAKNDKYYIAKFKYINKAFNEVMIYKLIKILQAEEIEYFDPIYDEEFENRIYILIILKSIYRALKYRIQSMDKNDLKDIAEPTIKIILIIVKNIYEKNEIMNYIHLLKIIFSATYKTGELLKIFTEMFTENDFRFIDFVYSLFTSNLLELKLISVELLVYAPVKIEELIKKQYIYTEDKKKVVRMLVYSLMSQEKYIPNKALYLLESFYRYFEIDVIENLLNEEINKIFRYSIDFFKSTIHQSTIFKKSNNHDSLKIRLTIKSIGKFAELLSKSKDLTIFGTVKKTNGRTINFNIYNEEGNPIMEGLDIGDYLSVLKKEFREIRKRPWFNNLYFISSNLLYLCTNKHKKGLEKLFIFVYNFLSEIKDKDMEDSFWNDNLKDSFEVLYNICFFLCPFRLSEKNSDGKIEDLIKFKELIFSFLDQDKNFLDFFLGFFVRNLFASIELSTENHDWTFFNFSIEIIENLLERGNHQKYYNILMEEFIILINMTNIYSVNGAIYYFKKILEKKSLYEDNRMFEAFKKVKTKFLLSYLNLQNFLDFKFKLKLNKIYTDMFNPILKFFKDKNLMDSETRKVLNNLKNFRNLDIFKCRNSFLLKSNDSSKYEISDFVVDIKNNLNLQFVLVKNKLEELKNFNNLITYDYLKDLGVFFMWLKEFLKRNDTPRRERLALETKILELIVKILELNIEFNSTLKEKRGTIIDIHMNNRNPEGNMAEYKEKKGNKYYYDFFNSIFVDDYDFFIKEFSMVIQIIFEILFTKIFKNDSRDSAVDKDFKALRGLIYECFLNMCFRLEKKIFDLSINYLSILKQDKSPRIERYFTEIVNKITQSLSDDKAKEPDLFVLFKLVKIHIKMTDLDRNNIKSYIQDFMKKVMDCTTDENREYILKNFNKLRFLFRILNTMYSSEKLREYMKDQLVNGLTIEYYLNKIEFCTLSLKNELKEMINKQSNSKLCEYLVSLFKDDSEMHMYFYYIFYEIVKDPQSIYFRERMCRESILERAVTEKINNKTYKWLRLVCKISKLSRYFLLSTSSISFFEKFASEIQNKSTKPSLLLNQNFFFNDFELFFKTMRNYLLINPFDKVLNLYIRHFLMYNDYDFKYKINVIIRPFESPAEVTNYFGYVVKHIPDLFKKKENKEQMLNDELNFYFSKISHHYIEFLNSEVIDKYFDNFDNCFKGFLKKINDFFDRINTDTKCEDIISFMYYNILLYKKINSFNPQDNIILFIQKMFKYSWNNIAHPKDDNKYLRNVCKLSVTMLINRKEISNILHKDKNRPLYDTILNDQKDILDDDSVNIWLESLKNLIPWYMNAKNQWFEDLLAAHEVTTDFYYSNITYSIQNRFWQLSILLRKEYGKHFLIKFKEKFFDDQGLLANITFDVLLILLTYIVNNQDKEDVKAYLNDKIKEDIIQKLIDLYRNEQDSSKIYIEKFYLLLVLYLKIFDDIFIDFNTIKHKFMSNKEEYYHKTESTFPIKVIKINLQNLTLIYYFLKKNEHKTDIKDHCKEVFHFIKKNSVIKNVYSYFIFCDLFTVVYNIFNICIQHTKMLPDLLDYANKTLREDSDKKDIFLSILIYHFVIENLDQFDSITIVNIEFIMDKCLSYLTKRRDSTNEQKKIFQNFNSLFEMQDDLTYSQDFKIQDFYKFFVTVLMKILVISLRNPFKEEEFMELCKFFESIFKNFSFQELDIRRNVIMMLKCLVVPHMVNDHYWSKFKLTKELSYKQKLELLSKMKIANQTSLKESNNKYFKDYLKIFYDILINFIKRNHFNDKLIEMLKHAILQNFSIIDEETKNTIVDMIMSITNNSFFDILNFFTTKMENHKHIYGLNFEYLDLYQGLVIFYSRVMQKRASRVIVKLSDKTLSHSVALYNSFLGILEGDCLLNSTTIEMAKKIFSEFYKHSKEEDVEKFFINLFELLLNDIKLVQYNLYWIIELLIMKNPEFMESEILFNTIEKSNKKFMILSKLNELKVLTPKLKILYYKLSNDKSRLKSPVQRYKNDQRQQAL